MKNKLLFALLVIFQLTSSNLSGQRYTFGEEMEKMFKEKLRMEERDRDRKQRQDEEDNRQYARKKYLQQQEEFEIAKIHKEFDLIKIETISKLEELNVFGDGIICSTLVRIIIDYEKECKDFSMYRVYDMSKAMGVREFIINKSIQVLKSEKVKFMSNLKEEKIKLDDFLNQNLLSQYQIAKIKKEYDDFMKDPFLRNESGEYVGYKFNLASALSKLPSSGTAFAITSDGYLVTNFHVVENAENITVQESSSNITKKYCAKLVISDRTNDLAIIKIEDKHFDKFSPIPFTIKSNIIDVGEEVFLLGYPLISSMGEEVKLTTGIVSSKSGFMNDITKYQISAPVQPGNSGGPLFDNNGNVIGIICAKHTGAENVSYAIKSTYLINLIGSIEKQPKLNKKNTVSKKKLTDKIKVLKKYVFIVTTNDI